MEAQPVFYLLLIEFPNQSKVRLFPSLLPLHSADPSYDGSYSLVLLVTKFYLLNVILITHKFFNF